MVTRRRILTGLASVVAGLFASRQAVASEASSAGEQLRFPGDPTEHNVVYQLNKSDSKEIITTVM